MILFRKRRLLANHLRTTHRTAVKQAAPYPTSNHAKHVTRVYEPAVPDTAPTTASNPVLTTPLLCAQIHRQMLLPARAAGWSAGCGGPATSSSIRRPWPAAPYCSCHLGCDAHMAGCCSHRRRLAAQAVQLGHKQLHAVLLQGQGAGHWISWHDGCESGHLHNWKWHKQQSAW